MAAAVLAPFADLVAQVRELARAVVDWARAAFAELAAWLREHRPTLRRLARAYVRHGRGYSSPARLAVDGHAYTRRLRARVRRR